jgi:hypothetical protein
VAAKRDESANSCGNKDGTSRTRASSKSGDALTVAEVQRLELSRRENALKLGIVERRQSRPRFRIAKVVVHSACPRPLFLSSFDFRLSV